MPTFIVNSTTTPQRKDSLTTRKSRQPIKHTKTFSGCWTCRERHVKCDEGKPKCNRCQKAGVQCQGYGIKLVWVDPDTQEREQNIRRAIGTPAIYNKSSSFMSIDVEETLDDLERFSISETSGSPDALSLGPFSVFNLSSVDTSKPKPSHTDDAASGNVEKQFSLDLETDEFEDQSSGNPLEEFDDDIETVISSAFKDDPMSSSPINIAALGRNSGQSLVNSSLMRSTRPRLYITRHLDLLPRRQDQRELIHHWTNFVCWHLLPVDQPSNPFRSVFTPMALEGLRAPSSSSNGSIALFHALCSASAFSRSQLLDGDTKTLTLAAKHYQLAIMHLRHSLSNLTASSPLLLTSTDGTTVPSTTASDLQRTSILATITMFSAMDMITGRFSEWRTHLQGGASWLATLNSAVWQHDRSSSMVYQGYLAIAALCNINLPSNLDIENEDLFLGDRYYMLDRCFGLTRPMLRHIAVMNSLVRKISEAAAAGLEQTAATAAGLDELESQLYEQTPDTLDLSDLTPTAAALTRHHAYVFYYASLIFFARAVRRLRPESIYVQALVECGVRQLEEIELLGGDGVGCTLVWPPLVVASECLSEELQTRMLSWYKLKRRHGFMNLEISKDIARELWRRRKDLEAQGLDGVVDIQWQDVLKDLNMDVVLF
ncbi:uncharacterized protein A1O9_07253 [Exophiala aquamarina CBS 119918]|uniref:Zn(2)-C6 fungal-type domain-containing protein n=1 Tax=Exophiala aquamarina CBS 119918 TaxID=1182545 RepID=A0A072PCN9_9EURO|nr:uncharacterized protein A1O9_07253 [Exophiala aquamarina CBS 119918]KEF57063.1 hypothetical protein A1O9_07253 [Exophiala aquamarina CBS 119918]